jgi:NitT/TauT family transport system ATP-binding protein
VGDGGASGWSGPMNLLEIDGLRKVYLDEYRDEEVVAVGDVSFTVSEGDFVSVLGPSGCGKTTVLNIIAGFIEPTAGDVRLDGDPVEGPGPDRGVVFQSFALFPWKTVRANVEFGPKMRKVDKGQRRELADKYLAMVGLEGFEDHYPHELSGGMQQRVGVARVLANEPRLMLMDEPFASVDAQTRMTLQEEVTRIWGEGGSTILFITHDVEEAVFLSDRVIVLSSRPSEVKEEVSVDIDRPRAWGDLIQEPRFRELTHYIVDLLKDEQSEHAEQRAPS